MNNNFSFKKAIALAVAAIGLIASLMGIVDSVINHSITKIPEGRWIGSYVKDGTEIHAQFVITRQKEKLIGKMDEIKETKQNKIEFYTSDLTWATNGNKLTLEKKSTDKNHAIYKGTVDSTCDNFTGTWSDASNFGTFKFQKKE